MPKVKDLCICCGCTQFFINEEPNRKEQLLGNPFASSYSINNTHEKKKSFQEFTLSTYEENPNIGKPNMASFEKFLSRCSNAELRKKWEYTAKHKNIYSYKQNTLPSVRSLGLKSHIFLHEP